MNANTTTRETTATMPRCSVVIRAHNEERHIGRLLEGIQQQTVKAVEIILVDSGSTDATLSVASRYPARVVPISPQDFSFGRALNLGCAASRGHITVIASAHVYPLYRDWLEALLAPFEDRRVALAYGKQRGDERTRLSESRIFARWFPEESDPDQAHPFCNNANAAIRRSVWEENRYDETLTGLEDIDWAQRVLARGHRIVYRADAGVAHIHAETYRRVFNRYRREAIAFKRLYPHERFTLVHFCRLYAVNVMSDAVFAARNGCFWKALPDVARFRLTQFWGTYRGYHLRGPVSKELRHTFYYPTGLRAPAEEPRGKAAAVDYGRIADPRKQAGPQ